MQKIQTKHKMNVLEALEDKTLESHRRGSEVRVPVRAQEKRVDETRFSFLDL